MCSPLRLSAGLVDRVGANRVLTLGSIALGLVYLAAANMPSGSLTLAVVFVAIQSVGQATATVPHTRLVGSWFAANRGMALGIAITGIPVVSELVSPLLSGLIAAEGWQSGYYLLAAPALLVALPLSRFFVLERNTTAGLALASDGMATGGASRSLLFWLLIGAMVFVNIPGGGFSTSSLRC